MYCHKRNGIWIGGTFRHVHKLQLWLTFAVLISLLFTTASIHKKGFLYKIVIEISDLFQVWSWSCNKSSWNWSHKTHQFVRNTITWWASCFFKLFADFCKSSLTFSTQQLDKFHSMVQHMLLLMLLSS